MIKILFDEAKHSYKLEDGTPLLSVNQCLELNGISRPVPKLDKIMAAANRGTVIHDIIAKDILEGPLATDTIDALLAEGRKKYLSMNEPIDIVEEHIGMVLAARQFRIDHNMTERPYHVEARVCYPELGVAGTMDLGGNNDEGDYVVDWKTSSSLRRHTQIQVAGYVLLANHSMGCRLDAKRYAVQLKNDGSYHVGGPKKAYNSSYEIDVFARACEYGGQDPLVQEWINKNKKED